MRAIPIIIILTLLASVFANSIPLKNIESLTLFKGQYTTRFRTSPIPQLNCEGGSAGCNYCPDVVQCVNTGSNGATVNWKCQATLPNGIEFGRVHVSCEGYQYTGDPNVLQGSCGLEYYLERVVVDPQQVLHTSTTVSHNHPPGLLIFFMFVILLIALVLAYAANREHPSRQLYNNPPVTRTQTVVIPPVMQQSSSVVHTPVVQQQAPPIVVQQTRYTTPVTLIPDPVIVIGNRPTSTYNVVHHHTTDTEVRNRSSNTHTATGFGTSSSD